MPTRERTIRSESTRIKKEAVNLVTSLFNELNWSSNPASEEDFGIDLYVTVFKRGLTEEASPIDFYVQVKGSRRPKTRDGYVKYRVSRKHVKFWLERPLPVLFLLCDLEKRQIYWLWIKEFLQSQVARNARSKTTITLLIPQQNCLNRISSTQLSRDAALMVWPTIHQFLDPPLSLSSNMRKSIFRFALDDLPYPFIDERNKLVDVLFISGPTRYELERLTDRFLPRGRGFVDVALGNEIVLGESGRNHALVSDILAALGYIAGQKRLRVNGHRGRLHLLYTDVDEDILSKHNIMCIACGDNNPLLPRAIKSFEMQYLVKCPVHHEPYETSEAIRSEISGNLYEKLREDEWAGYIVLFPNPWNSKKAFLICGGNKAVGTQAALHSLLMLFRGQSRLRDFKGFPARVVCARGVTGNGFIDKVVYLE
jgi:hypothetical protein